jgi:hypothetical protein
MLETSLNSTTVLSFIGLSGIAVAAAAKKLSPRWTKARLQVCSLALSLMWSSIGAAALSAECSQVLQCSPATLVYAFACIAQAFLILIVGVVLKVIQLSNVRLPPRSSAIAWANIAAAHFLSALPLAGVLSPVGVAADLFTIAFAILFLPDLKRFLLPLPFAIASARVGWSLFHSLHPPALLYSLCVLSLAVTLRAVVRKSSPRRTVPNFLPLVGYRSKLIDEDGDIADEFFEALPNGGFARHDVSRKYTFDMDEFDKRRETLRRRR